MFKQILLISPFEGEYYPGENNGVDDGLFYVTFGVITVHIQPIGPTLQHLEERHSVRYWGSRLLPGDLYDGKIGKITLPLNLKVQNYLILSN